MVVKTSYGIVCYRINYKTGRPEIAIVKKSRTYAFMSILFGDYKNDSSLCRLFSKTTYEEKMDVLLAYKIGNYDVIWFKGFTEMPSEETAFGIVRKYELYKARFIAHFLSIPQNKLIAMLERSANIDNFWELPKGRCRESETTIETAVREFSEETGLNREDFSIVDTENPIMKYQAGETSYAFYFYIAKLISSAYLNRNFRLKCGEISDSAWIAREDLRFYNINSRNRSALLEAFEIINKDINGRVIQSSKTDFRENPRREKNERSYRGRRRFNKIYNR